MSYRVGAFVRVSTDRVQQLTSLKTQVRMFEDFVENKPDWEIQKIYQETESGTKYNKAMKELLQDIENHAIDIILFKDISRLARNCEIAHKVMNRSIEKGIQIVTIDNTVNTLEGKRKSFGFEANRAQDASEETSEKIKNAYQTRMKMGIYMSSTPPFGYRLENQKLFVKNDFSTEVVKRIFDDYLNGKSPAGIAKELTSESVPTPAQVNNRSNATMEWKDTTVRGILKNKHYMGVQIQGQTTSISITTKKRRQVPESEQFIKENAHEAIISKEVFAKVQERMKKRKRNTTPPRKRMFSRIAKCADCGGAMWYRENRKGYVCGTYSKRGREYCSSHKVKEEELVAAIKAHFHTYTSALDKITIKKNLIVKVQSASSQTEKDIHKMKEKIEVIQKRMVKFATLLADGVLDSVTFQAANAKAKEEVSALEEELERLENCQTEHKIDLHDIKEDFIGFLFSGANATDIVHRIVDEVVVKEDGTPVIHFRFSEPEQNKAS
ncbi:recombinase family protein [Alteribacter lacisalsi]|nr:recombinase family protein [Alteribacter lacisalsi]